MMIIDSHSHVMLPAEEQIARMDRAGVDKTVLFSTLVHPERAQTTAEFEQEMGRLQHILAGQISATDARTAAIAEQLKSIRQYPDRFLGFGAVPLGVSRAEIDSWIETEVVGNGFLGLGEFTLPSGNIQLLEPIIQSAGQWDSLPLWVHTFAPLQVADLAELAELARKYPEVPLIFGHLGGLHWLETIKIVKQLSHVYLDISAFYTTFALSAAMQELPERTLFSSDSPYGDPEVIRLAVERSTPSQEVRERVLGGNFSRLARL